MHCRREGPSAGARWHHQCADIASGAAFLRRRVDRLASLAVADDSRVFLTVSGADMEGKND